MEPDSVAFEAIRKNSCRRAGGGASSIRRRAIKLRIRVFLPGHGVPEVRVEPRREIVTPDSGEFGRRQVLRPPRLQGLEASEPALAMLRRQDRIVDVDRPVVHRLDDLPHPQRPRLPAGLRVPLRRELLEMHQVADEAGVGGDVLEPQLLDHLRAVLGDVGGDDLDDRGTEAVAGVEEISSLHASLPRLRATRADGAILAAPERSFQSFDDIRAAECSAGVGDRRRRRRADS